MMQYLQLDAVIIIYIINFLINLYKQYFSVIIMLHIFL